MRQTDSRISTGALLERLFRTRDFKTFRKRNADEMQALSLPAYLAALCKERGETHEQVIKRSGLDRVYGHQIFSGLRKPSRDKVLQLAFGLNLSVEEAQNLLKIARQSALYPRIERDAAILFCLNRRLDFIGAQMMLDELGLRLLGNEAAHD